MLAFLRALLVIFVLAFLSFGGLLRVLAISGALRHGIDAHRIDHRHAAGGDVVAVADPAARLPADLLAEIGARRADELE